MEFRQNRRDDGERKVGFADDSQVSDAMWSLFWVFLFFMLVVLAAW
jgi:hypothetical protein